MIGDRRTFGPLPGGGYVYTLVDEPLSVEMRYLRREYGQLFAEIVARCEWAGVKTHRGVLASDYLSLSRQPARRGFAKYCAERAHTKPAEFDWEGVIDAAGLLTIEAERQGDEVIVLDDAPEVQDRDIDIHGLTIPADAASMLIAHGDSLKSMILLYTLGTMAQSGRTVLYLDWEWSADRHKARKRRLLGSDRLEGLHYLRCHAPLVVEADRVRRYCDLHHVDFLGVDSIGLACDGKLIDDDVAIRFHRALANLPPSLCAAHVPKSSIGTDARTDSQAFGSVYFSNLCRASWAVKKQPGATDDIVSVGLFPQKQNDGERRRPVGFEFAFTDDRIDVRRVDLANVDGLAERLPLAVRMIHLLKRGPLSFAEIATQLDAKVDSVIKAVSRGQSFTKVPSPDGVQRIALLERQVA